MENNIRNYFKDSLENMYGQKALKEDNLQIIMMDSKENESTTNIIDFFMGIEEKGIKNLEKSWTKDKEGFFLNFSEYFKSEINEIRIGKEFISSEIKRMEDIKSEVINGVKDIESITKGKGIKEYLDELEKRILKYDSEIVKLNRGKDANTKRSNNIVIRLRKWIDIFETIPWYMKRLSFLKVIKKRIRKRINPYIKKDDASLLRAAYTLDDIVRVYNDEKDRLYKKSIEIEEKIKILENKKIEISEEIQELKNLRSHVEKVFKSVGNFIKKDEKEKFFKLLDKCLLKEFNEYLDKTITYREFWLAVHYYEAKWIEKEI
ncbi:MAG: hypothetical protein ACRDAU_12375 [Clostridium sp.]